MSVVHAALAAVPESVKVLAWIVAAAAVDAVYNAVTTGQAKIDPLWVPVINLALFYAKELVKAHRNRKGAP